jgi:hypothetical protein
MRVDEFFDGFTRPCHKRLSVNDFSGDGMPNKLFNPSAEALYLAPTDYIPDLLMNFGYSG